MPLPPADIGFYCRTDLSKFYCLEHIKSLFSAIVLLLQESGYVSLDVQYIDGTKVESASNRYTFVWRGSVEKNKVKLESKIQSILSEVDKHIEQDIPKIGTRQRLPGL